MTIDKDVLKRSVTRDDYEDDPRAAPLYFIMPHAIGARTYTELMPWWCRDRDYQLRETIQRESMWAAAIFKAVTKYASKGWQINDTEDSKVRTRRAQELYLHADMGKGWVSFISRHLRDFLLTDNGAFVEVVRASSARGAKIMGLVHLDSCRCIRTADPTRPIIYRDREGREHIMRDHQVLMFADMPDPSETYNGVGFCAASRAYATIAKVAAMEQYLYEKMTGDGATEIAFVNGINAKSLGAALITADETQKEKGSVLYKGKIIIPIMTMDAAPEVANIPLKNVPDGFDAEQERSNAYMIYANAIGVPVQDIQPLSGQGLGTGTQTVILAEAAEGMGLAAHDKQWTHANNEHVLPESTTFMYMNNDIRDQKAKAEVSKMRADERAVRIGDGEITIEEARQLALDAGDLPKEMQPDMTAGGVLGDTEKPIEDDDAKLPSDDMDEDTEEESEAVATKADDDLDRLIGGNWSAALVLAKEMVKQ